MLCDRCNENIASVHIKKMVNGKVMEIHLCSQCAKETKETDNEIELSLKDFLIELMSLTFEELNNKQEEETTENDIECPNCHMKYTEFKENGKFGCIECINAFKSVIPQILKKLHGNTYHEGKYPEEYKNEIEGKRELVDLKNKLNKAIKLEEYEEAAKLRDRIKGLEKRRVNE